MSDEEGSQEETEQRLEATEAFSLLAHDTRMAAMEVLWEADGPVRFSEIADRAGIGDTGNFNYHFASWSATSSGRRARPTSSLGRAARR